MERAPAVHLEQREAVVDDEFEVRITKLSPRLGTRSAAQGDVDAPSTEREEADPDEYARLAVAPYLDRRQHRLWKGLVVGGIVVMVLVAVLASIPDIAAVLPPLPWIAAPSAPLSPAASLVYLEGGVPWGKLNIDERPVALAYGGQQQDGFRLAPGTHILRYSAAPFADVICTISAPGRESDTCTEAFSDAATPSPIGIRMLDLRETPDRLPANAYARLRAAVVASIATVAPPAMVRPGDRYQSANRTMVTTALPLPAQFAMVLNSDPYNLVETATMVGCVTLCGEDEYGSGTPQRYWFIAANVVPLWRYTAPNGRTVEVPVQIGISSGGAGIPLDLGVQWDGAWRVVPFYGTAGNALCFAAYSIFDPGPALEAGPTGNFTTDCATGRDIGDGCLITLRPMGGSGASTPSAEFLYRFGLLLAANRAAHALVAELPLANAAERERAQQLASAATAAGG